jgi:GNAT superfamily N-acetyltransferase
MIRGATVEDIPTILRFVRELAEYERSLEEVEATEEALRRDLFEAADPRVSALIAENERGEAVGFAVWFLSYSTWAGRHGIYLEDLYVTPSARGGGYGKALLRELARIAVERGYGRFEWAVLDWNEPAINVYKSIGARFMDEWTINRLEGEALRKFAGT